MGFICCSTFAVGIICLLLQIVSVTSQYEAARAQNSSFGVNSNQQSGDQHTSSGYGKFNAMQQQQEKGYDSPDAFASLNNGLEQQRNAPAANYRSSENVGEMTAGYTNPSQNGKEFNSAAPNGFGAMTMKEELPHQGRGGYRNDNLNSAVANGAGSRRGTDNGNPLNKLNLNYLGLRPDYCKRPSGQFAVAHDCTLFYNCHDSIAWVQKCPEGLGFNEATYQCDYAEAVGCVSAAAASASAVAKLVDSINTKSYNKPIGNGGYGGSDYFQAQSQQLQNKIDNGPSSLGLSNGNGATVVRNLHPTDLASESSGIPSNSFPSDSNQQSLTNRHITQNNLMSPLLASALGNSQPMITTNNVESSWPENVVPPLSPCVPRGSNGREKTQSENGMAGSNNVDFESLSAARQDYSKQQNTGLGQNTNQLSSTPNGGSDVQPGQERQNGFGSDRNFGGPQPEDGTKKGESAVGENVNGQDFSTVYGPNGPLAAQVQCQPCSQPGAVCPAYPSAGCFDDVCGGCRARFFIRRTDDKNPFAEVTSMCDSGSDMSQAPR